MKKITKKMKGKKVLSLVLAAIMLATTFNMALPMLKLDAGAADGYVTNGTIASTGITQTRVVGTTNDAYKATYAAYASDYLNGCSEPTDIVIPGLDSKDDYVIQGMTYYPKEDWFFVTAYYHTDTFESAKSSKVFCLDAATGEFVALLDFYDVGTKNLNTDHGGGIAISEHNIYYSCGDKDRSIAYAPLSALDNITKGEYRTIQLMGEQTFYEVGSVENNSLTGGVKSAYTAYVCYDQGVLWMGNFYDRLSNDYGTKANASYDNMVFGYRLSGENSEEEWANLTSNTSNAQNCQGNPSYVIALGDDSSGIDIKWVQYATVDSGKLYLSRSASSGDNPLPEYDNYSHLTVADIDLTTPGTHKITILTDDAGKTKEITNAYVLSSYHDYPMMPMSEGLCVVDDYLFVTYEGASNKYINNCPEPVDVIWKVDQYELLGVRRDDNRETACYEKVDDISSINNTDEYIVVYESDEKNPVTQEHILYALDSHGGHNGFNLPKEGLNNQNDTTKPDHTVGIVGHKISEYDIDGNKLYLTYPEEDDVENIRWKFVGSNGSYTLKNSSKYFTEYHTLQVSGVEASMAKSTSIGITLTDMGETWRIQSGGEYLWCNDGTHSLENTINSYYTSYCNNKGVASYTEQPGTFHSNATGTPNVLGRALTTSEDSYREFEIYKRVIDDYASTEESRVYTSMDAALQEDGTYTINLETYATAETQYQTLKNERPTDFIFVLDASGSMTETDCSGYIRYDPKDGQYLAVDWIAGGDGVKDATDIAGSWPSFKTGVVGYEFTGDIRYYTPADGKYNKVYIASHTTEINTSFIGTIEDVVQKYWVYYKSETDGLCYLMYEDGTVSTTGISFETLKGYVDAGTNNTSQATQADSSNRCNKEVFKGVHFKYSTSGVPRIDCMRTALNNLTLHIAENSQDHRIAITQFGSWHIAGDNKTKENWLNTGMYANDSTNFLQYSTSETDYYGDSETIGGGDANTAYAKAFYNVNDFAKVRTIVDNMVVNQTSPDPDTFSNFAFDMANGIINNSGKDYLATGDRNVAIIMITDGVPGWGSDYPDMANTVADIAINETYEAKSNGASVYSVQIGNNSIDNFSMNLYMDAVSSEYVTAKSRVDLGDRNPDGIEYHIDVATGTADMFSVISDSVFSAVQKNSKAGLVHLDTASIIREELKDAFIIDDATFSAALIPGSYDKIGRMSFGEPVSKTLSAKEKYAECENGEIAYNQDTENKNKLEIWGYNYTDQYISKSHPGNKLRITITGVLADHTVDLTNTSINNNSTTAIYRDSTWLGKERAFKYFPTEYFTIPEYTYVLDYGFDMYDDDVNGTMLALDEGPYKQDTSNYSRSIKSKMVAITEDSQNLIYSHNPAYATDSGYVLIERDEDGRAGTYDWFEIKVVPASNVLYEETALTIENGEDGNAYHWNKKGDPQITYQDLSTENDVYGYDSNYANSTGFSNGTHYYSTVDKQNILSDVASVTFKGTGFELLAACGERTGIQLVAIKKYNKDNEKWETIQAYFTDTYYKGDMLADEDALLYQVPVVKWEGTEYGEYKVEVSGFYASGAGAIKKSGVKNNLIDTGLVMNTAQAEKSINIETMLAQAGINDLEPENVELVWFDDNSVFNGGTGPAPVKRASRSGETTDTTLHNYVDGFRIYNPLEDTSNYIKKERDPQYINVLNNLMTAGDTVGNIAYIVGTMDNLTWKDYNKVGPQDEVYLKSGTEQTTEGISFNTNVAPGGRVMISLRAVNGPTTAKINGKEIKINSATEMYYDITETLTIDENTNTANVTVINTGSGILSVNNIKLTNTVSAAGLMMFSEEDMETVQYYASMEPVEATVENGVVTPVVEEEVPEDNTNTDTETEGFDIFSFVEMLIAFIEKILYSAFGAGSIA